MRRGLVHRFDGRSFHLVDLDLRPRDGAQASSRTHPWWKDVHPPHRVLDDPYDDNQTHIFAVFPDSRGDLWLGEHTAAHDNLLRWRHDTGALQRFGAGHGAPTFDTGDTFDSTLVFTEDSHGGVWIGVIDGGVARFSGERFVWMRDGSGAPLRNVKDVSADRDGHLWIASSEGIWRVDRPGVRESRERRWWCRDRQLGRIKCMTVDDWGRLYVGTPSGLEQVDPKAGRVIRRYSKADGLAHNEVLSAFRDRSGVLWFGTYEGVSRFIPSPEAAEPAPPVFVNAVSTAGGPVSIAELGATTVDGITLPPDQRQIQIEFGGLPLGLGDPLRFEYRLVGADRDWIADAGTRNVSYAQLTRGAYRFEVRAVTASGVVSAVPAVVAFRVLAPVWARWWFIAGVLGLVGLAAHLAYRMRTARLVELERIRTRIAADLHDDIGANLSRIAMMSDVARDQVGGGAGRAGQLLASVATISRESVDAMSDIVWAVDPSRDRLKDLAQRMRRFASDVLTARDIALTFRSPESDLDWPVSADVRREVLLIFKETVNNVARHSGATEATVDLTASHGELNVTVKRQRPGIRSGRGTSGKRPREHAATGGATSGERSPCARRPPGRAWTFGSPGDRELHRFVGSLWTTAAILGAALHDHNQARRGVGRRHLPIGAASSRRLSSTTSARSVSASRCCWMERPASEVRARFERWRARSIIWQRPPSYPMSRWSISACRACRGSTAFGCFGSATLASCRSCSRCTRTTGASSMRCARAPVDTF